MAGTPARALARCAVEWIYQQASKIIKIIKAFLLGIIAAIDVQILALRGLLEQADVLKKAGEYLWSFVNIAIEEIRTLLTTFPGGPLAEFCPSFYESFLTPADAIFESAVASLEMLKERYMNLVSIVWWFDYLISYWTQIKIDLQAYVEIMDDALYLALIAESNQVP